MRGLRLIHPSRVMLDIAVIGAEMLLPDALSHPLPFLQHLPRSMQPLERSGRCQHAEDEDWQNPDWPSICPGRCTRFVNRQYREKTQSTEPVGLRLPHPENKDEPGQGGYDLCPANQNPVW